MRRTGLVFDDRYLFHDTGSYHPENPGRLTAIRTHLAESGLLARLPVLPARRVERHWLETVHDAEYIKRFEAACLQGRIEFDHPDNPICPRSFEVAGLAVGGVLAAVDKVMAGEWDNAFCAVRPPGHHAEPARAMGFCFFNNIAVAARYLQRRWGVERVAIVDVDVHHGNGTQAIFERDPSVLYCSIHEHPSFAYPGTGREFDKGAGSGYGTTVNVPVLPGKGDAEYMRLMERDILPALVRFRPEVLLLSSGFDGHAEDDMADMRLSSDGYTWMFQQLVTIAEEHAAGRLVSVLEGGYSRRMLPRLVREHIETLRDFRPLGGSSGGARTPV